MADPALAFRTDREVGILTVVIHGALRALTPITTRTTEGGISATPGMALKEASLALSLVALTLSSLITVTGIPATHTENANSCSAQNGENSLQPS